MGEEKSKIYTCPSCGGGLKWNIKKQSFECEFCHTPGEIDASKEVVRQHPIKKYAKLANEEESFPEETLITCHNCGAQVSFKENETATLCPMCGSSQIDADKQVAGVPPDGVIPFKVDKADAQMYFKKWVKSRWFAPNRLKESYQQGKLDGIYLPFWTYDSESEAYYKGKGGNYVEEEDDEGNTHTRTEWYPVSGHVRHHFDDIQICDASERAQGVVEDILPFSTEEAARPYAAAYLSGAGAEHYVEGADKKFEDAEDVIRRKLDDLAEDDIRRKGYDTADVQRLDMEHHDVEYKHLLLPVWLSAFAYKGKNYTYMINGETGEVGGERPYSVPKIVAAILAGILLLFVCYNIFIKDADAKEYTYPEETITCNVSKWEAPTALLPAGYMLDMTEQAA